MNTKHLRILLPVLLALIVSAALLSGCNEDDIERSLGKQTSSAVEKEFGVNTDPVLGEWVNTLGHRLVGQSHRQNIDYNFRVVNTDMVNAFAAPWGYVYLTEGMLGFAKSEDEVAFILSHEIGHVANRDSIKSVKKNILFSIGSALVGGKNEALGNLTGLGAGLLLLHYSREDERDSDVSGSTYAYGAGYDPAGGMTFFDRLARELEKDRPSSVEHLFLTHPPTASRIAAQKARPELDLKNPVVASRIGRGYASRFAYGTAAKYYKMALETKPEAVETRLTLAEAYQKQGLYDLARAEFESVLQRDPQNTFATTGLQALTATPPQPVAAGLAEQQQAEAALAPAAAAVDETAALVTASHVYTNSAGSAIADASGLAKQCISGMMDLGDLQTELSDRGKEMFIRANGAVSAANNAAFSLEAVSNDLTRVSDLLRNDAVALKTGLERAAAGQAMAGDVAIYKRSLAELRHGRQQLERATGMAQEAQPLVQQATREGSDTVAAISQMVRSKNQDKYFYPVRVNAEATAKAAAAAQEATKKVKKITLLAESRGLLARLNLAALGASPEIREMYDGMVAHYCSVTPAEVKSLRAQGMGYGDSAFILMAARSQKAPPQSYLGIVNANEVIEGLRTQGISFQGPVALLRFLANAVEAEVAARS